MQVSEDTCLSACRDFFERAVVVITSSSPSHGSAGLCLNRDLRRTVKDYVTGNFGQASACELWVLNTLYALTSIIMLFQESGAIDSGCSQGDLKVPRHEGGIRKYVRTGDGSITFGFHFVVNVADSVSDSGSDSDLDGDISSSDLANLSVKVVKSAAKDLSNTFLDSPEMQQHFSGSPVMCGGPVPTRALEVSADASGA